MTLKEIKELTKKGIAKKELERKAAAKREVEMAKAAKLEEARKKHEWCIWHLRRCKEAIEDAAKLGEYKAEYLMSQYTGLEEQNAQINMIKHELKDFNPNTHVRPKQFDNSFESLENDFIPYRTWTEDMLFISFNWGGD